MKLLRILFVTTVHHNILVRAVHVPSAANAAADALSRGLIQMFRRLRPAADDSPAPWDWETCSTLTPSPS